MQTYISSFLACAMLAASTTASAQDVASDGKPHGVMALGVGVVPQYDGAEDMRAIPFALADVRWGNMNIEVRGLRGRADLLSSPRLAAGPVIGARLSREDAEGPLALLPEIDTAIEAGGFVGYRFGGSDSGEGSLQTELTVVSDVSGVHDGLLATASASYIAVRHPRWSMTFDVQTTWASEDYARTYFGIEPDDAAVSGLSAYHPKAGIKDVGVGVSAGYWFTSRFGVIGRVGANYMVGDFADSPIVDEGSKWQPTAGLTLAYRF